MAAVAEHLPNGLSACRKRCLQVLALRPDARRHRARQHHLKPSSIASFSVCRQLAKRQTEAAADRATRRGKPYRENSATPDTEGSEAGPVNGAANHKAANKMDRKKPARAQRLNASHVVEAELVHLDWATKQPALRTLDATYWRRRVLAVKRGFELTEQQVMRLEKILQRLGPPLG